MIAIQNVVAIVRQKVEKLAINGVIELKTYKRDRGATIVKISEDCLRITETGFENAEFEVPVSRLKKTLKSVLKKEFPRSNKVRVTVIDD